MTIRETRLVFVILAWVSWSGMCFFSTANVLSGEIPPAPQMPVHWNVVYDLVVPAEQVKAISSRLGADLSSVRNTIFDVNGKRVQINVIVASDSNNAEKLLMKLKSMKVEESLLRNGTITHTKVNSV